MCDSKIKVLVAPTEQNPFAIIYKPANLPSAPLNLEDDCAINQAIQLFPQLKNVVSSKKLIEYGLLHRIDNQTCGLLLIAATQQCYDFLSEQQSIGEFKKFYRATVQPLPENYNLPLEFPPVEYKEINCGNKKIVQVQSKFRYFGAKNSQVRPVTEKSGKAALTKAVDKVYSTTIEFCDNNKVVCSLTQGFKHQVRCHLRWLGLPIIGDKVYNPNCKENQNFEFEAFKIEFIHPVTKEIFTFEI